MTADPITIRSDEELAVLLGTLGDTEQQIAATLRGKGITGHKAAAEHCPIANWLRAETGCTHVEVDAGAVYLKYDQPGFIAQPASAVDEFIWHFDDGDYPDLIEPGQES